MIFWKRKRFIPAPLPHRLSLRKRLEQVRQVVLAALRAGDAHAAGPETEAGWCLPEVYRLMVPGQGFRKVGTWVVDGMACTVGQIDVNVNCLDRKEA